MRWDTGCSFVDYDLDGKLDLAVSGYVDFDTSKVPEPGAGGYCQWRGLPVMCGPRGLPAGRNFLFHNEGGGKFKDVSEASGIGKPTGCYGFTVLASDFDNDGQPDLYVACDSTPSLLYRNLGDGKFEEMGVASGSGLNEDGQEQAGMGVAVADYDEDGFMDIVKTNFSDDTPNLYHNNGDGTFTDEVYLSGLGVHTQYLGLGHQLPRCRPRRTARDPDRHGPRVSRGGPQSARDQISPAAAAVLERREAASSRTFPAESGPGIRRTALLARLRRRAISTTTARSKW